MFGERPPISFGPPVTYEEALYRLDPGYGPEKDQGQLLLATLKKMLTDVDSFAVEAHTVTSRVFKLTEEDIKFMERWSFARDRTRGSLRINWDGDLSSARTSYFEDFFPINIPRTLRVWWLSPGPTHGERLIAIKAEPGFVDTLEDEWYVALLSRGEYSLLIGERVQ